MFGVIFFFENTSLKHVSFLALFLAVSAAIFLFFYTFYCLWKVTNNDLFLLLIQNHCQEPKSHDSRIHWASDNNKLRITNPSIFCNRARETVIMFPYPKLLV